MEWISTKDEMPKVTMDSYLCCVRDIQGNNFMKVYPYTLSGFEVLWEEEVTHWMPLPEPPKEGES